MSQKIIIPESAAGERLDVVLAELTGQSRSSLQKLIKDSLITVEGEAPVAKQSVRAGQRVEITQAPAEEVPAAPDLEIIYEDDDLMVINKPAGLAVHLSESGRQQPTVAAFAASKGVEDSDLDRPGIVHRLDKGTSGLMVVAKNIQSKEYLQDLFRERKVEKEYLALVRGRMDQPEATINLPIDRDQRRPTKRAVVPGGRPAVSHYRVELELDGFSLLKVKLETGRTHQIRVHMAHLGHPIAGDALYGGPELKGLSRQFLHAGYLKFEGPSGQLVKLNCPLPPDLQEVLDRLKKGI